MEDHGRETNRLAEVALMSPGQRFNLAGATLSEILEEGRTLGNDPDVRADALAEEIDRRTNVGFEASMVAVMAWESDNDYSLARQIMDPWWTHK